MEGAKLKSSFWQRELSRHWGVLTVLAKQKLEQDQLFVSLILSWIPSSSRSSTAKRHSRPEEIERRLEGANTSRSVRCIWRRVWSAASIKMPG